MRVQQDRLLNLRLLDEIEADTFASKNTELRDRLAEDFANVRYSALTLLTEIPAIPKDYEGQRYEVAPLVRRLADATAMLTGDQQQAAGWLVGAGLMNDRPHWMPMKLAASQPRRPLADEFKEAEQQWRQQTSKSAATSQSTGTP